MGQIKKIEAQMALNTPLISLIMYVYLFARTHFWRLKFFTFVFL